MIRSGNKWLFHLASIALAAVGGLSANALQAQTWQAASGTIRSVALSSASNEAFRIFLVNGSASALPSTCSNDFAYINTSDDNYQAKVAALLSAYAQGKVVSINYTIVNNFCQITDMGF